MKTHITGKVEKFLKSKNIEVMAVLQNTINSEQIKGTKWDQFQKEMHVENKEKGIVPYSQEWQDKPAKRFQWYKENNHVRFEIWYKKINSNKGDNSDWEFKSEYIVSVNDLEAFMPIHTYNMNIMKELKNDFANSTLEEANFLTRN